MTLSEQIVANFLYEHHLWWVYEQPVFVLDDKARARIWTPDFFLPEVGVYIEVCGAARQCYAFRKEVYKKNRVPVIFVETYKNKKWGFYLIQRIKEIQESRNEFLAKL